MNTEQIRGLESAVITPNWGPYENDFVAENHSEISLASILFTATHLPLTILPKLVSARF